MPPSPNRVEGGPSEQQQANVRLCIQLDQIINQGNMKKYVEHTERLLKERQGEKGGAKPLSYGCMLIVCHT